MCVSCGDHVVNSDSAYFLSRARIPSTGRDQFRTAEGTLQLRSDSSFCLIVVAALRTICDLRPVQ